MKFNITEGITLASQMKVKREHLASNSNGKLEVLSTISVIKLMEDTCIELIDSKLPNGFETVSVEINVKHIAPARENDTIFCTACLKYVDDRRLFFDVAVVDEEKNEIALGAQERYIVKVTEFMQTI